MSAHLDSGTDRHPIKLSEAARSLGCHLETLRLRVRSGEIVARRGAHGAFFISQAQLAKIRPPLRSGGRTFDPDELDWTWRLVEDVSPDFDVDEIARLIEMVRRDQSANREFYNLLSVARLRRAGLTTAEVASQVGISSRHVRLLAAVDLDEEVERLANRQQAREKAAAMRKAMAIVIELENRVHAAGLKEHAMRARRNEPLRSTGRPRPALRVRQLDRAMRVNLRGSGVTREQLEAIAIAGISIDVLNELLLNGFTTG